MFWPANSLFGWGKDGGIELVYTPAGFLQLLCGRWLREDHWGGCCTFADESS